MQIVCDPDIEVVWDTRHLASRQIELVAAGNGIIQHTIVETPLALSASTADQADRLAAERGRQLLVHHPRRSDPDFRQALVVARDPQVGPIYGAKFVAWSYALPPAGASRGHSPFPSEGSVNAMIVTNRFVTHALDQLVLLVNDRPVTVFAVGDSSGLPEADPLAGLALALRIRFQRGCQAEIDIRLDSPVSFQSGWLLTAARVGYANGRRHTLTDDGEVFDSPVASAISDVDADQFEWLARQIRSGVSDLAEETRVRNVVAILDAARRSLASQQVVSV
jgi:predicted dehydrogenase